MANLLPLYTVYHYRDDLYKVVKFKHGLSFSDSVCRSEPSDSSAYERLAASYSRSRRKVLEYALCNDWDYFITITVSPVNFDRYDLDGIYRVLSDFFKFYRRNFSPLFRYLIVPERHSDGAWHFHGLVRAICDNHICPFVSGIHPQKLIDKGYVNFPLLSSLVGFVSLGAVENIIAASFYVAKYVLKSMDSASPEFYSHLYYCSRGLKSAVAQSDIFSHNSFLDSCLTTESSFVECGWVHLGTPDSFWGCSFDDCFPRSGELWDSPDFGDMDTVGLSVFPDCDSFEEYEQVSLSEFISAGWCNG